MYAAASAIFMKDEIEICVASGHVKDSLEKNGLPGNTDNVDCGDGIRGEKMIKCASKNDMWNGCWEDGLDSTDFFDRFDLIVYELAMVGPLR